MKYQQFLPPAHLKNYIRYFWLLEDDENTPSADTLGPLADGCPGIIFQHPSEGNFHGNAGKYFPEIFLYGQTITPLDIKLDGKFKTLGICFHPHALKSIFRFHASELTDSCIDLSLVMNRLKEPLLNAQTVFEEIDFLSAEIYRLAAQKNAQIDRTIEYALSQIVKSKGNIVLKNLLKEMQLTERGFQRRFDQQVGIPPKLFARVCRFQSSLAQLKNNRYVNLSDIAFDNGYADQSHFIRSFKEFAGFSPYQFQKRERQLTDNFSAF